MMKTILLTIFIAAFMTVNAIAVEINNQPIQQSLSMELNKPMLAALDKFDDFDDSNKQTSRQSTDKKSTLKAGLLSIVLPGMGEYYLGNKTKARYFFGAEALSWIGYISFHTYGNWKKDDMIDYARLHANAQLDGRDDEFIDYVGFYPDIYDFNNAGRVGDRNRPYLEDTPENHWYWQTDEEQTVFRTIKNKSREAYRRANFALGAALINRIVSVIDVIRDSKRKQREIDAFAVEKNNKIRIDIDPLSYDNQVKITWYPGL